MNSLVDEEIIEALYDASRAGVAIDLIVRGICCLRPGIAGVSDGIRVISIVGRFLEHARLFFFANGGQAEYYLGSADWMPRNFDRRVEAVAPVDDPALHPQLRSLLAAELADNRRAWDLLSDGTYVQRRPGRGLTVDSQDIFLHDPWGMERGTQSAPSATGASAPSSAVQRFAPRQTP